MTSSAEKTPFSMSSDSPLASLTLSIGTLRTSIARGIAVEPPLELYGSGLAEMLAGLVRGVRALGDTPVAHEAECTLGGRSLPTSCHATDPGMCILIPSDQHLVGNVHDDVGVDHCLRDVED